MRDLELEQILRRWAQDLVSRYTWLTIRFEYSERRGVYLVSYSPSEKIDESESFARETMEFENRMNDLYDDNAPLFCDEEELFKLSSEAEVIRYHTPEKVDLHSVPKKKKSSLAAAIL